MYSKQIHVQLAMLLLVCCSSFLLGVSIGDRTLVAISITGAVTAFVLVDRLRWIELSGWMANVVSIVVLVYTMRQFIGAGSAGKLVAVAYLLTYLLTVLMFQKKTPRLCWQLMVLSVLQTSLAAIFNLNFENGLIFVVYFVCALVAMILQNDFYEWSRIQSANERNQTASSQHPANFPVGIQSNLPGGKNLRSRMGVLWPWLIGCLAFAFLLFHSLPHTRQQNESALALDFSATGKSWQTDLDETGLVQLSNKLIFRAQFFDYETEKKLLLNNQPYFRGMAFNKLVFKDGKTSWTAPYDHVFDTFSYSKLTRMLPDDLRSLRGVRRAGVELIVEPTNDPLLFVPMPVYRKMNQELVPDFDRDLSALTRKRFRKSNQLTSFRYTVVTLVDSGNRTMPAWPYRSFIDDRPDVPMQTDSPEHAMLTAINAERYPQLVQTAQRVAAKYDGADRIELCQALLQQLSQSNGYSYTLDYRTVDRNLALDPVEDFFANHRSGHCAVFASSLVLMLRAVDIPARYVVGFHGGSYNNLTDCYVVHGRNAHAWVEAYIPPEQCTPEMFEKGMARGGGAWLTLDPTPPVYVENANDALDLARSIWQDYVISPDHNKPSFSGPGPLQAGSLADSWFASAFDYVIQTVKANAMVQATLVGLMVIFGLIIAFREMWPHRKDAKSAAVKNGVRQWLGQAISLVSAQLGDRIQYGRRRRADVKFYNRLEKILKQNLGLQRRPCQTQQEFAVEIGQRLVPLATDDFRDDQIARMLQTITSAFYQARFSSIPLDNHAITDIENQLQKFEQTLKQNHPSK